jgi:hypothetical protein
VDAVSAKENFGPGPLIVGPDGLIEELPCRQCGKSTLSVVELVNASTGYVTAWFYCCRQCQAQDDEELRDLRRRFDAMIEAGVSKRTANEVMIRWFVGEASR